MPVKQVASPWRMEDNNLSSMFSCKLVVFSERQNVTVVLLYENKVLTSDSSVLEAKELGLVITRDCGVGVHISGQERQVLGQVSSCHS